MTMPQGNSGLDSGAWGSEWVNTDDASLFGGRTRSVVEAHYKTSLSTTSPWVTARDALFTTLMAGFNSLTDFIGSLAGAIAGAVGGTLTNIASFMTGIVGSISTLFTRLFNAAGNFIADIGQGIVDGVETVGGMLTSLWNTLTGQTGSNKTVANVSTALTTVTSNANNGFQIAGTARDNLTLTWNELYEGLNGGGAGSGATGTPGARTPADIRGRGATVRDSAKIGEGYYYAGANILINPGFEDTAFAILNQGVAVTANVGTGDVARSGTRSLRLIAAAGSPISYLAANTTAQVYLPCTAAETYYMECWVRGKSTNTQATAANGIILGITAYDSAKANPVNVTVGFSGGTSYNADWVKVSGKLVIPVGRSFFTPYVGLNSSTVTNGHTYYFDDVVVREVTDAAAADAKVVATNTALYGTATPAAAISVNAVPSISTAKITSGTFATGFIADDAVTTAKIAPNAVTAAEIAALAVTNDKVASGQDASKITTGSLATAQVPGVTNLQTSIVAGYTVVTVSTSQTWTKPANLSEIYVACFGGGQKGNPGAAGQTSSGKTGGNGGNGGDFIAQQLNPVDVPTTVACTIGAGTSTTGMDTSFGTILTTADAFKGYVATPLGMLATGNVPANGGTGGSTTSSGFTAASAGGATIFGVAGGAAGAGVNQFGAATAGSGSTGGNGINFGLCQTGGAGGGGGGAKFAQGFGTFTGGAGGTGGFPSGGGGGGGACSASTGTTYIGGSGGNGGNGLLLIIYKVANT